jgi:hypothetical protein
MKADMRDFAAYRWLNKTVLESRLLDDITVYLTVKKKGQHEIALRTSNLEVLDGNTRTIAMGPDGTTKSVWRCRVMDKKVPWVALAVPDGDVSQAAELYAR